MFVEEIMLSMGKIDPCLRINTALSVILIENKDLKQLNDVFTEPYGLSKCVLYLDWN